MPFDTRGLCPPCRSLTCPPPSASTADILGFEVAEHAPLRAPDDFGWCLLRRPEGTELMLNTACDYGERPDSPDPIRVAAHADTCIYVGCPDVDAAYQHLIDNGLTVNPPKVAYYGMKQLYLTDPDNYGLCFQRKA